MYFNWGGRFVPTFMMSLTPWLLREATWAYQLAALMMLVGLLHSSLFLLRSFFPEKSNQYLFPGAMLFTSFFLVSSHTIVQALYWYMATVTYTFCLIIVLYAVGLLKRQYDHPSLIKLFLLFISSVLMCGSNEISVFLWNFILLSLIIYSFLGKKKIPTFIWVLFAFSIIVGLFEVLAPGNFIRSSLFEKSGRVGRTVGNGLLHWPLYSVKLLSLPIFVFILAYHQEIIHALRSRINQNIPEKRQIQFFITVWFVTFFITMAMGFWSQGRKPVSRAMNVIQLHYFLLLPFVIYLLSLLLKNKNPIWWQKTTLFCRQHFSVLLILSFFAHPNTLLLVSDYYGKFWNWRKDWETRLELLRNSKDQDITIQKISDKPDTTGFKDLQGMSPEHLKLIYGTKSVTIIKDPNFQE